MQDGRFADSLRKSQKLSKTHKNRMLCNIYRNCNIGRKELVVVTFLLCTFPKLLSLTHIWFRFQGFCYFAIFWMEIHLQNIMQDKFPWFKYQVRKWGGISISCIYILRTLLEVRLESCTPDTWGSPEIVNALCPKFPKFKVNFIVFVVLIEC